MDTDNKITIQYMEDLLRSAIPVRNGIIREWNKSYARKFVDQMLNPAIGKRKAEEILKGYLEINNASFQYQDALRFIMSN